MSSRINRFPSVVRFIRRLRGGSQPFLAEADDGLVYVVKLRNNLQGENVAFNESMGTELYRAVGLPVPDWTPILITDDFIANTPECWIRTETGLLRPMSGPCFGSRFFEEETWEILPQNYFSWVDNLSDFWCAWLVDAICLHTDHRQVVFKKTGARSFHAFFIDHGYMFGGPDGREQRHFAAARYLDRRIYQHCAPDPMEHCRIDAARLWKAMKRVPEEWLVPSAVKQYASCIIQLQNRPLVTNLFTIMVEWQARQIEPGRARALVAAELERASRCQRFTPQTQLAVCG